MKKIVLLCCTIFLLTGCGNNMEEDSPPIIYDNYGRDILPGDVDYYYTFTGESKHFSFSDGLANYQDNKAELDIKGLKQKSNEEFTATISVYFNDKFLSSKTYDNESIKIQNKIVGEYGYKIKRNADGNMYGEIDAFMETRPEEFEKAIKVVANYCDSQNNCEEEIFTLNIEKHE